jgi:hypothetical protein
MFEMVRHTLDQLEQLSKLSNPEYALEFARRSHPDGLAAHLEGVMNGIFLIAYWVEHALASRSFCTSSFVY